jgi:hypothetical protein
MCDLLGRLIDFTPRSTSPEKNYTPNYPISSTLGLDCQFGEIKPNLITSIQIPRLDLEQYRYDSSTSERTPIKHPSRIEEGEEKKIYCKKCTSVRELARIIGKLSATRIQLSQASLYLRQL